MYVAQRSKWEKQLFSAFDGTYRIIFLWVWEKEVFILKDSKKNKS